MYTRRTAVRKKLKTLTDDERAFMAWEWFRGRQQRDIAKQFGYANSSAVSQAISDFLRAHSGVDIPRHPTSPGWYAPGRVIYQDEDRKALVPMAVAAYLQKTREAGCGKIRIRVRA